MRTDALAFAPRTTILAAAALLALAAAAGCGSGGPGDLAGDAAGRDEAAPLDPGPGDGAGPEVPREDAETVEPPPGCAGVAVQCLVPPGGAFCPCERNEDCDAGRCLPTPDGRRCAVPCQTDTPCPCGWACENANPTGEAFYACVAPYRLCQPCRTTEDCRTEVAGAVCLEAGPLGRFCATACSGDRPCPAGYDCVPVGDGTASHCRLPEGGACPCTDVFRDGGYTTTCYRQNDQGRCEATRTCDQPCGAREPATDTCNLQDDDCDGLTDEDLPSGPCPIENAWGTCPGTTGCLAGTPVCEGREAAPESCNGRDDDCDGTTDEDTAAECFPTVCDTAAGACKAACAGPADCQEGYECASGACFRALGRPCDADGQCATGFCTDGTCCEARCHGTCESCALPERAGRCDPVPADADPADECASSPLSTCGLTGACDGARACAFHAAGLACGAPACRDALHSDPAPLCDGASACVPAAAVDCTPFLCDGATGTCRVTCDPGTGCDEGFECDEGVCRSSRGRPCAVDGECASGACVDGRCCQSRCGGTCERCDDPADPGLCLPVPAGQDPADECLAEDASTCGQTGACSGSRTCALFAAGAVCSPAACAGSALAGLARRCDGIGGCQDSAVIDCAPYGCRDGACLSGCTVDGDCSEGHACAAGRCLRVPGRPCDRADDCATGFCADGVCCSAACDGTCESCTLADAVGTCTAIPAGDDPADECGREAESTCGRTGACSGLRACALWPAGTVCEGRSCAGATVSRLLDACDGGGRCVDGGTESCSPRTCDDATGLCRDSCVVDGDCQAGFRCKAQVCLKGPGLECGGGAECASGFCTDGTCCESACGGPCESCALPGREGTCAAIPAGTDPDDECARDEPSTCGQAGFCSGLRSCQLHPADTVCRPARCETPSASQPEALCDGAGTCVDGAQQACFPYACDDLAGTCRTACTEPSQCQSGYTCAGGRCLGDLGLPCRDGAACATGSCVDGVCCDGACDGTCESCAQRDHEGTCRPVPGGTDPAQECAPGLPGACGLTGWCSGTSAACQFVAEGSACGAPACAGPAALQPEGRCDGAGGCTPAAPVPCAPYACDAQASPPACRASCTVDADCDADHGCAGGTCRLRDGAACTAGDQCAGGGCCGSLCTALATDAAHCGSCDVACANDHGTTSCAGGACAPACADGWGDCNASRPDGCERPLDTLADCGACGRACALPNATVSCGTGACTQTGCNDGWLDCTADPGCERNPSIPANACAAAVDLGSECGDDACGTFCSGSPWKTLAVRQGYTSYWFKARSTECNTLCGTNIVARVTMTVPADANYDLYVWKNCGVDLWGASVNGTGLPDQVEVRKGDGLFTTDSFDYWIEVRFVTNPGCGQWQLTVEHRGTC